MRLAAVLALLSLAIAGAAPLDPLGGMDAQAAYERGIALAQQGRHTESLVFLRHAVRTRPDLWQTQFDYGTALANSSVEIAPHRHLPGPVSRSSWERVAMMREAQEHLAGSEALAADARQHGLSIRRIGTLVGSWGLEWDAVRAFQLAMIADPASSDLKHEFANEVARLKDTRGAYYR
jgi:hypothetical protein